MVTFDTQVRLDNKLDKIISMISKVTVHGSNQNRPFKPKIFQGKWRTEMRHYYDQDKHHNRYRSNSEDRKMFYRGRAQ